MKINGFDAADLPENVVRNWMVAATTSSETSVAKAAMKNAMVWTMNVRDNLRMAAPGATDEAILAALKDSGMDLVADGDVILDELVRKGGGGGSRLLIVRMHLARVLLRNTPIVLLDDVTAGLNRLEEMQMMDTILKISSMRFKTIVVCVGSRELMERLRSKASGGKNMFVLDNGMIAPF